MREGSKNVSKKTREKRECVKDRREDHEEV